MQHRKYQTVTGQFRTNSSSLCLSILGVRVGLQTLSESRLFISKFSRFATNFWDFFRAKNGQLRNLCGKNF